MKIRLPVSKLARDNEPPTRGTRTPGADSRATAARVFDHFAQLPGSDGPSGTASIAAKDLNRTGMEISDAISWFVSLGLFEQVPQASAGAEPAYRLVPAVRGNRASQDQIRAILRDEIYDHAPPASEVKLLEVALNEHLRGPKLEGAGGPDVVLTDKQVDDIVTRAIAQKGAHGWDGQRLLLVLPDLTRSGEKYVGQIVRKILHLIGGNAAKIDIMIALGTHEALNDTQLEKLLGISTADRLRDHPSLHIFNHNGEKQEGLIHLGDIPESIVGRLTKGLFKQTVPVNVNRVVAGYDHVMTIGPVLPHEVVGVSGGWKYWFPGISETGKGSFLAFFHWLGAVISIAKTIGVKNTPQRALVNMAGKLVPVETSIFTFVPKKDAAGKDVATGLYYGTMTQAWEAAADLTKEVHVTYLNRPYKKIIAIVPPNLDRLWEVGKAAYKSENVVADGGEIVIYGHHVKAVHKNPTFDGAIRRIGYHNVKYFLGRWDQFKEEHWGILAHLVHVRGLGESEGGTEGCRTQVTLATGLPRSEVEGQLRLSYRDPDDPELRGLIARYVEFPADGGSQWRPEYALQGTAHGYIEADHDTIIILPAGEHLFRLHPSVAPEWQKVDDQSSATAGTRTAAEADALVARIEQTVKDLTPWTPFVPFSRRLEIIDAAKKIEVDNRSIVDEYPADKRESIRTKLGKLCEARNLASSVLERSQGLKPLAGHTSAEMLEADVIYVGLGRLIRGLVGEMIPQLIESGDYHSAVGLQPAGVDSVDMMRKRGNGTYLIDISSREGIATRELGGFIGTATFEDEGARSEVMQFMRNLRRNKILVPFSITDGAYKKIDGKPQQGMADIYDLLLNFWAGHRGDPSFLENARISVLPTDNIQHNGSIMQAQVLELAAGNDAFIEWLPAHVSFHDTMVDRITDYRRARAKTGYASDPTVIETEALPPLALVVYDPDHRMSGAWNRVPGVVVTDNKELAELYDAMKLQTANATHTALVYAAAMAGKKSVIEAIQVPEFSRLLENLFEKDIRILRHQYKRVFDAMGKPVTIGQAETAVRDYFLQWRARLDNPYINHNTFWIAQGATGKIKIRFLPTMAAKIENGESISEEMAFAIAAVLRFITPYGPEQAVTRAGRTFEGRVDTNIDNGPKDFYVPGLYSEGNLFIYRDPSENIVDALAQMRGVLEAGAGLSLGGKMALIRPRFTAEVLAKVGDSSNNLAQPRYAATAESILRLYVRMVGGGEAALTVLRTVLAAGSRP